MKIERKKGAKSFRIVNHNKKLLYWILALAIIFIILVWSIIKMPETSPNQGSDNQNVAKECTSDSDCIPASCCHPASCAPRTNVSKCGEMMCTMDCRPNTMDCGQGSCSCVNNKCSVEWSE